MSSPSSASSPSSSVLPSFAASRATQKVTEQMAGVVLSQKSRTRPLAADDRSSRSAFAGGFFATTGGPEALPSDLRYGTAAVSASSSRPRKVTFGADTFAPPATPPTPGEPLDTIPPREEMTLGKMKAKMIAKQLAIGGANLAIIAGFGAAIGAAGAAFLSQVGCFLVAPAAAAALGAVGGPVFVAVLFFAAFAFIPSNRTPETNQASEQTQLKKNLSFITQLVAATTIFVGSMALLGFVFLVPTGALTAVSVTGALAAFGIGGAFIVLPLGIILYHAHRKVEEQRQLAVLALGFSYAWKEDPHRPF